MGRRGSLSAILIICILTSFILACFVAMSSMPPEFCGCDDGKPARSHLTREFAKPGEPRLAILVPFRDRFDELLAFAPHMEAFLKAQRVDYHIFVVNQADRYRFNRAALINVGFLRIEREFDYIAMHDVDLLPLNGNLSYAHPEKGPFHIASPEFHPRYNYSTFVGGILLVDREHFRRVNGMSNKYWGWGLEDDEFYVRLKEAKLNVTRPVNITTGRSNTFKHIHDRLHRKRDTVKCFNQYEATRRRDRETGLDTVKYENIGESNLTIDGIPVTVLNVKLHCDKKFTPWCECNQQIDTKKLKKKS